MLLPPLGLTHEAYAPVFGPLARRFELFALDTPGFGGSDPLPGRPLDVPRLADGVVEALDALGLERPHVVGNSLGGRLALELASRGRARSVTALSPVGMTRGWESAYGVGLLTVQQLFSRLMLPVAGPPLRRARVRTMLFYGTYGRPARLSPGAALGTVRSFARSRGVPRAALLHATERVRGLDRIACPVTIAWGRRDTVLLPRQALRYVEAIPGAELRWLPRGGHIPMSDEPELVVEAIVETARRADATDGAAAGRAPEPSAAASDPV